MARAAGRTVRRGKVARGWTKTRRREFLEQLAATMNVRGSARAVGVSEQSAYRLRARDEEFRAGWREAIAEAYERLELEMLRSAIGEAAGDDVAAEAGPRRAAAGRASGTVDSRLAMFLMKMHRETARGARAEADEAGDPAASANMLVAKLAAMCERMTGDLTVRAARDAADHVWKAVPAGSILPIRASHVRATGTTAANLLGLY